MSAQEVEVVQPEQPEKKPRTIAKRESTAIAARTPDINDLMAQAVATGNMDTIERVFALRQELKREAARSAFFNALSLFQSMVPPVPKSKEGYGYNYAPLGVIEATIQKPMEAAGLSKKWRQIEEKDVVTVICVVSHSEGHSEETPMGPVPWDLLERTKQMNGLQHRGAVITYLQRYTLIGALGLASADEDPDGVVPKEARAQREPVRQPQTKPSAQKAANGAPKEKVQLEPAASPDEALDVSTQNGLAKAMEKAALGNSDLVKRFPAITGLEQVKKTDARAIMNWIADPQRN